MKTKLTGSPVRWRWRSFPLAQADRLGMPMPSNGASGRKHRDENSILLSWEPALRTLNSQVTVEGVKKHCHFCQETVTFEHRHKKEVFQKVPSPKESNLTTWQLGWFPALVWLSDHEALNFTHQFHLWKQCFPCFKPPGARCRICCVTWVTGSAGQLWLLKYPYGRMVWHATSV